MNRVSSTIAAALMVLAVPQVHSKVLLVGPPFVSQHKAPPEEVLRTFTGTIVSVTGGMFALKEDKTGVLYGLDNQALARQFAGKMVTVSGTLDKAAIIHVENIEEQKACADAFCATIELAARKNPTIKSRFIVRSPFSVFAVSVVR